jgi:hypothetical protein
MNWLQSNGLFCVGTLLILTFSSAGSGQGKKDPKTGEFNTPAAKGERKDTKLKVGDPAPDFSLPVLKKDKEVKLSSFKDKKPVVLIFGSYT